MYEAVERNVRGTWILCVSFILLVAALGYVFGTLTNFGYPGAILATLLASAVAWASYYFSDQIILNISGAREASREDYPYLHNAVEGLAIAAGVPPPRVYLIDDPAPNAFATGRDPQHAAIAVTAGLLEKLDRLELEGVLAHEMSHIQNYDIRLATVATILVGTVALLSDWFLRGLGGMRSRDDDSSSGIAGIVLIVVGVLLALLAPLIAQLVRLAISRQREFLADANGAMLTRYPEGLARALEKIGADPHPLGVANKATAHMYIVNPLHASGGRDNRLFDTHPPLAERVHRLREMAGAPPREEPAPAQRRD